MTAIRSTSTSRLLRALQLVDHRAREHWHEDARDLRARSRGARRRRATRGRAGGRPAGGRTSACWRDLGSSDPPRPSRARRVRIVLEAVPNVSEGRDASAIDDIASAFSSRATLLDVHADADHHRSVFTLAGEEEPLVEGLLAGIVRALELVDLRVHDGVHPRVGAVDVVPLVPLTSAGMATARRVAAGVAQRVAAEAGVPVFLYGELGGGRVPAFFRRGGLEELSRRVGSRRARPRLRPVEHRSPIGRRAGRRA